MSALDAIDRRHLLALATEAAGLAGAEIARAFRSPERSVTHKGAIDLVTETDLLAEERIREVLGRQPEIAILGEEGGRSGPESELLWVVDPIDGTTNFAHRVPHCAVSIGLWSPEGAELGVVFNPCVDELFSGDGQSAWRNGHPLPPLEAPPLREALLATGFPYDRQTNPDNNVALCTRFLMRTRGVRRFGAAALDLAWVAAGRLDGFWEPRLQPWDIVAGAALVRSMGGRTVDYAGRPWRFESPGIVAGAPEMVAQLLAVIAEEQV